MRFSRYNAKTSWLYMLGVVALCVAFASGMLAGNRVSVDVATQFCVFKTVSFLVALGNTPHFEAPEFDDEQLMVIEDECRSDWLSFARLNNGG